MINKDDHPFADPSPTPGTEWATHVATDPVKALEMFVRAWHPARQRELKPTAEAGAARSQELPMALAALCDLVRRHPTLQDLPHHLLVPPTVSGPDRDRLVFASENQGCRHWGVPLPLTGEPDPPVWRIENPYDPHETETRVEGEPLSGFLLQYVLCLTELNAACQAWSHVVAVEHLTPLLDQFRRIPLKPFSMTYTDGETHCVGPGMLAAVLVDQAEAVVSLHARQPAVLEPFRDALAWRHFMGEELPKRSDPGTEGTDAVTVPDGRHTAAGKPTCGPPDCRGQDQWTGGDATDPPF
ncbi:hypothetical protein [Streptomyces sp. NPDC000229]|uniref:hypothetical protein n=1 Tax=Streptomyces sp. NPDC000229 TaxID=3154247 RepID=UPI0033310813